MQPVNLASTRIIGLTDDDICVDGSNKVIGYTSFGWSDVIGEYDHPEVTGHELGHTFYHCEQYNQKAWHDQNAELKAMGGCQNYYPDGTTHCSAYGSLTTKCPEFPTRYLDCRGRKIPVGKQIGRSIMSYGNQPVPRRYDCFEKEEIQKVLICK